MNSHLNLTQKKINDLVKTNKKIKVLQEKSNANRKSQQATVRYYADKYKGSAVNDSVQKNEEQMTKIMENKLQGLKENERNKLENNVSYYENLIKLMKKNKNLIKEISGEKEFNEDYKEVQKINSAINEKEKIIQINNQSYKKKNEVVRLLILGFIGAVILAGFSILYFIKGISGRVYIYLVLGLIGVAVILIIFHIFRNTSESKIKYATNKAFNDMLRKSIRDILPEDMIQKCPTNCKKKGEKPDIPVIFDKAGNEIITDSGQNPWRDGDISVVVGSPDNLDNPIFNNPYSPEPRYGPDPNPTMHTMKWQGNPAGRLAFDGAINMQSDIPADFWPGYKGTTD